MTKNPQSSVDIKYSDCVWPGRQSPNVETVPREKMRRITPMYPEDPRAPFYLPGAAEVPPMARLYLTREKLVHKPCDEEALLSMVVEEQENSQTAERCT